MLFWRNFQKPAKEKFSAFSIGEFEHSLFINHSRLFFLPSPSKLSSASQGRSSWIRPFRIPFPAGFWVRFCQKEGPCKIWKIRERKSHFSLVAAAGRHVGRQQTGDLQQISRRALANHLLWFCSQERLSAGIFPYISHLPKFPEGQLWLFFYLRTLIL